MPLWSIYHPPSTFTTPESKQQLAADITALYTAGGLPAFYVVVNFIPLPLTNTFVGGKNPTEAKPFIRLVAEHIAVHIREDATRSQRMMDRINGALQPHIKEKGYDWEVHVDETPRGLWAINGLPPPPFGSAAEKKWADLNQAVPWDGEAKGDNPK
ncbi:putative oxalocrotonate tautomerase [Dichotomopilus funicola]|uniref:Oxalocrotonate tautomerase n=1 Tax=Dichotomopilus funicola TaxID=1934379 RepID=A0AAN6V1Q8_9PEZI|nr:putative oxalocrotonate tautomerase [Dichotomopilus funicola]